MAKIYGVYGRKMILIYRYDPKIPIIIISKGWRFTGWKQFPLGGFETLALAAPVHLVAESAWLM